MSTSKGNTKRTRPQKHQNKTAYKNNLHDKTEKTKFLNSLAITGVCNRCKDILDWKIKYKKYKPLTAPRKCVGCESKTVKHAYHILCGQCSADRNVCPKCCVAIDASSVADGGEQGNSQNYDVQSMLKTLPERKRRTVMRLINKTPNPDPDNKVPPEMMPHIEDLIKQLGKNNLYDDDFDRYASDDFDSSQSDSQD